MKVDYPLVEAAQHDGVGHAEHRAQRHHADRAHAAAPAAAEQQSLHRADLGALHLRLVGVKNLAPAGLATPTAPDGKPHPNVVLDLDYTVFMPRKSRP